jgi:DNA-binding transcriptional LysR family regulator
MWLIQLGMGIGFLPKPVVDASSFADKLSPMLPDDLVPKWNVYLMGRPHGARSAPAELLFETAAEHFATDLSLEKA